MRAEELIGKWAYRMTPVISESGPEDWSFTLKIGEYVPVFVNVISKAGIEITTIYDGSYTIYSRDLLDDNWIEYDEEMDKYPWKPTDEATKEIIANRENADIHLQCKYCGQGSEPPCRWCDVMAGEHTGRNYFQPKDPEPEKTTPDLQSIQSELKEAKEQISLLQGTVDSAKNTQSGLMSVVAKLQNRVERMIKNGSC